MTFSRRHFMAAGASVAAAPCFCGGFGAGAGPSGRSHDLSTRRAGRRTLARAFGEFIAKLVDNRLRREQGGRSGSIARPKRRAGA